MTSIVPMCNNISYVHIQILYFDYIWYYNFTFLFLQNKTIKVSDMSINLKLLGERGWYQFDTLPPLLVFPKKYLLERGPNVTFNIIISHIFPENFIKISQVVQKIWRFSTSILTNFINLWDFFHIFFNFHPF